MGVESLGGNQVHDAEAPGVVEADLGACLGHEHDVVVAVERRAPATASALDDHHAPGHAEVAEQNLAVVEVQRSEEHTSELQSLMRISYAVFCLQKKNINQQ